MRAPRASFDRVSRSLLCLALLAGCRGEPDQGPPPPPLSGGTLLVATDGTTAIASDPDRDLVHIVDLANEREVATIALRKGDEPGRVVEDAARRAHVALRRGGAVVAIDLPTRAIVRRTSVCAAPRGIAYDARSDLLHVACATGELVSLGASDGATRRTLRLGRDLRDVVVDGSRLLVSRFRAADVSVLDTAGVVTEALAPPKTASFGERRPNPQPVANVQPSVAWRMVPWPGAEGGALLLHQRAANEGSAEEGISTGEGGYASGQPCGGLVHSAATRVQPGTSVGPGHSLMGAVLAVDVAVSPDLRRIAVVAPGNALSPLAASTDGSDAVPPGIFGGFAPEPVAGTRSQALTVNPPQVLLYDAPPAPAGASDPNAVFPPCPGILQLPPFGDDDTEVVAVAWTAGDALVVQTRAPALFVARFPDWNTVPGAIGWRRIALAGDPRNHEGYRLFHRQVLPGARTSASGAAVPLGRGGGGASALACASCHPEGGDDARVWNFQTIGPRRTQSVWGGILATAPLHWSGDMRDFSTLVSEVMGKRMGGGEPSKAQADRLARWIDAIPAPLAPAPQDPAAVLRGEALFRSQGVGCSDCHVGQGLTNNRSYNVGTRGSFQVPTLLGVAWRAPFMHDGCAATLRDRFGVCGGGDQHGNTSHLAASDVDDLVVYLETL